MTVSKAWKATKAHPFTTHAPLCPSGSGSQGHVTEEKVGSGAAATETDSLLCHVPPGGPWAGVLTSLGFVSLVSEIEMTAVVGRIEQTMCTKRSAQWRAQSARGRSVCCFNISPFNSKAIGASSSESPGGRIN